MKKLALIAVLFPLFFFSCKGCGKEKTPRALHTQGDVFSFRTLDGKRYTFDELKGKVVVVEFFASWCSSCRMALPHMAALYRKYKDKGLFVVGLSFDQEGLDVIKRTLRIPFPVGYAPEPLAQHFRVSMLPAVYIFDRNGRLAGKFTGYSPEIESSIEKKVEELLKEG